MRLPGVWEGLKPGRSLGMRLPGVWEGLKLVGTSHAIPGVWEGQKLFVRAATSPLTTRGVGSEKLH